MSARRSIWRLAASLLVAAVTTPARADTPPPAVRHEETAEEARTEGDTFVVRYTDTPYLSLRLTPIELIAGIGQVGAEVKIRPDLTVVAQLGVGRVKTTISFDELGNASVTKRKTYVATDLQLRYYLVGSFGAGIYGSADANYTWLDSDQLINAPLINYAAGLRSGLSFGGTYTSFFGVGLDMQFLVHRRLYQPTPSEPSTAGVDHPGKFVFGAELALTYVF